MALIRCFVESRINSHQHPTEVDCGYQVVTRADGQDVLQLATFGSDTRQTNSKVSQTIQLNRDACVQLMAIMRSTFPGI